MLHEGIDDVDSPCGSNQTQNVHPKPTHVEKHVVTFDVSVFVYFGNVCVGIFWLMSATMKKMKRKTTQFTRHRALCCFTILPTHWQYFFFQTRVVNSRFYLHTFHGDGPTSMLPCFIKCYRFCSMNHTKTISKHIMQGTQKWHQKDANGLKAVPGSKH